ncbi:MAG: alpha-N-arabinofuranosidase [Leptolinea sp.]|nr:alpha-N-arabinofuranosidase [Leptolinea sp.]
MKTTKISLHPEYTIAAVDQRLFGGFLEHLGRAIYQGIYQPDSIHVDKNGFRKDVLQALKALRFTTMRYPGGNFASGYHWLDGVGPKEKRPVINDLAWCSVEPNQFGTDEFIKLCRLMDWQPMLACNLGTGTPEEARNWVEYCNLPTGTRYSSLRNENNPGNPYNVKLWCLGNEMDGPWQLGHVPARDYALRAQQAAKMMRDADPSIELTASGSCTVDLPTYLEWDREVLDYMGDYADYISLHRYATNKDGNIPEFLASIKGIDRQIEEMDAVCRFIQARKRSQKRAYLSFDEWNVWYRTTGPEFTNGRGQFAAHLLEEEFDLSDALVVAGFLNSFFRHTDCVKMASLAQVVNAIAPILTRGDDLLLQTTYYPLLMIADRREGTALQAKVSGPGYASKIYGQVDYVDASAIINGNKLNVFLINRNMSDENPVSIYFNGLICEVESAEVLTGSQADSQNTFSNPNAIRNKSLTSVTVKEGMAELVLPPLSYTVATFEIDY